MAVWAKLVIGSHDYTQYVKAKTGLSWERENTNDEDAGRDVSEEMHTNVTSHQRKLSVTLGPMPFSVAQQLESDLQGGDDGIQVQYPDLKDGQIICNVKIEERESAAIGKYNIIRGFEKAA